MPQKFSKYQGTGNDFILFDNRDGKIDHKNTQWIRQICDRRFGIGADGVMLLENEAGCDFRMVYFNSDGNESSMCGNGGRCIVNYARQLGIIRDTYTFLAIDGLHEAYVKNEIVYLKMQDVLAVSKTDDHYDLNTGSPHYVTEVDDVQAVDVKNTGASIRYSEAYAAKGTNVNFLDRKNYIFHIRTYERGVEDETLSCGTGVTAAGIVAGLLSEFADGQHAVALETMGGKLQVQYEKNGNQFTNIWLIGPGILVFNGEI